MVMLNEMLESDLVGLSETDILVILTVDGEVPLPKYRLQKMVLMYCRTYGPGYGDPGFIEYPFGGFSDDVNESVIHFISIGAIEDRWDGLLLTDYGAALRRSVLDICGDRTCIRGVENIREATSDLDYKPLSALAHRFYKDILRNSPSYESMPSYIRKVRLDGIPLEDYDERRFRDNLRDGVRMTVE